MAELTSLVSSIISGTGSNISTYNGSPTITSSKLLPITGCYKAYYVEGACYFTVMSIEPHVVGLTSICKWFLTDTLITHKTNNFNPLKKNEFDDNYSINYAE